MHRSTRGRGIAGARQDRTVAFDRLRFGITKIADVVLSDVLFQPM